LPGFTLVAEIGLNPEDGLLRFMDLVKEFW